MVLKIFWSKKADYSFENILNYLLAEFGEAVAKNFAKNVDEVIGLLKIFPELGTEENSELRIRGFVVVKQVTLIYKVKKDKIVLLNFYDNRQKPKKRKL